MIKHNKILVVLHYLVQERRRIYFTIFGFMVVSIVLCFVIPPKYKATAVIMPPINQNADLLSMALGFGVSGGGVGGVGYMPGMITPSDVYAYVARCRTIAEEVIRRNDLVVYYKKGKSYSNNPQKTIDQIVKKMSLLSNVTISDEGFIEISYIDRNPVKAANICNSYFSCLDGLIASMSMTQGKKAREFIEKRLVQEQMLLSTAEDSLQVFQTRYKTLSLPDEVKASIEVVSKLDANIIQLKADLEYLKSFSTQDNPQVVMKKLQLENAVKQLDRYQKASNSSSFVPLVNAPAVAKELGRRMRAVKIHDEVCLLLRQQLEQAKILEAKDTPTIQILVQASPPTKRYWPKRSIILIGSVILGFLTACCYVLAIKLLVPLLLDMPAFNETLQILVPVMSDIKSTITKILHPPKIK